MNPHELLKKLSRNLPTGQLLFFCNYLNLHISLSLFKLRVSTRVTSKWINQANYLYRTSISRTTTHPQYCNLIHIKSPIINLLCSFTKLSFPISTLNVRAYFPAISGKLLHTNMQKTLRTTQSLFNNWGKIKAKRYENSSLFYAKL